MAMEWLKEILTTAAGAEEGFSVDAAMAEINKAFPEHAVPKNDFNAKVEELKTANLTIKDLKKSAGDNEELQKKVTDYEEQVKALQKQQSEITRTYALKDKLSGEGVLDPDYIIYKMGGLDKFTFDKDGAPVGVADAIKGYKKDKSMAHLFRQANGSGYNPAGGGTPSGKNPFAKDSYNLTEQGKLLRENPARARQLAAEAGVNI